jgi:hypothetical protein
MLEVIPRRLLIGGVTIASCSGSWRNAPASPDGVSDQPDGADASLSGKDPVTGELLPAEGVSSSTMLVIMLVTLVLLGGGVVYCTMHYVKKTQLTSVLPIDFDVTKERIKYKNHGRVMLAMDKNKRRGDVLLGQRLQQLPPTETRLRDEMIQTRVQSLMRAHSKLFGIIVEKGVGGDAAISQLEQMPLEDKKEFLHLQQTPHQKEQQQQQGENAGMAAQMGAEVDTVIMPISIGTGQDSEASCAESVEGVDFKSTKLPPIQRVEAGKTDYTAQVAEIYQKHNPEVLEDPTFVQTTVDKFAGNEGALLQVLRTKYEGAPPMGATAAKGGDRTEEAAPTDEQ